MIRSLVGLSSRVGVGLAVAPPSSFISYFFPLGIGRMNRDDDRDGWAALNQACKPRTSVYSMGAQKVETEIQIWSINSGLL
jgi:hypothetical protein